MAQVWNDNTIDFKQKFKDDWVEIPAQGFIEMPYAEAVSFKSYPFPMKFDGMGQQLKESFKMIRIEGKPDGDNMVAAFKCHADGTLHASKDALNAYVQSRYAEKLEEPQEALKKKPGRQKLEA